MLPSLKDSHQVVSLEQFVETGTEPIVAAPIFPGLGCGFFSINHNIPSIRGACAVMIAPALCAYNARLALSRWERSSLDISNNLVFLLYEEEDVIHGAAGTIRQALLDIYRQRTPQALFVVTSCLPEIVGEDVAAVVRQVNDALPIPVLLIKTENFTDMTARTSQENALLSFTGLMSPPAQKVPKSINIIGSNARDFAASELNRALQHTGFSINTVIPSRCNVTLFNDAPRAAFNILLTRGATVLGQWMEREYGTPFFLFEPAYTPEAIQKKYSDLGLFLGVDLLPFVADSMRQLDADIVTARNVLGEKTAIISYSNGRVFDMALLLEQAGLRMKVIGINHIAPEDMSDARRLQNNARRIWVVRTLTLSPLDDCIAFLRPDYYISFGGPDATFCAKHGVRARALVMRPHPNGFEAARRLLQLIQKERPGLSTLLLREEMRAKAGIV